MMASRPTTDDGLAAYDFASVFNQQSRQFHGNPLDLLRSAVAPQLAAVGIEFELAKTNDSWDIPDCSTQKTTVEKQ